MKLLNLTLTLALSHAVCSAEESSEIPDSVANARDSFDRNFIRVVSPIQEKYRRALQQFQRSFVRAGNLAAAQEAATEIKLVNLWDTVTLKAGARKLKSPELQQLLRSYENAVTAALKPVLERYAEELKGIKSGYLKSGDLETSLLVDAELKKAESGNYLPTDIGAKEYFSSFNMEEFRDWLTEQEFEFSGAIAGRTRLKFHENNDTLIYRNVDRTDGKTYEFKMLSDRAVEIDGRFRLEFEKDLHSGTFESSRGTYPIIINPTDEG